MKTHQCPGCRVRVVPDTRLACPGCWNALSERTQQVVRQTAGLNLLNPVRRAALEAAMGEWRLKR